MTKATDIIVKTNNPKSLDEILHSFGACVVQDDPASGHYMEQDGGYVVRCLTDPRFIEWMLKRQGYGEFIRRCETLV